jgi:hypothetical protein
MMSPAAGNSSGRTPGLRFLLLVLTLPVVCALWNLSTWPSRIQYPGELSENIEGMCLVRMIHLRQGVPVYSPPTPERFDAMIYGPLYFLLGSRLIDPAAPAYRPLRVLSMVATVGCILLSGALAYRLSRSRMGAVLASAFLLSYGLVSLAGVSARGDVTALALLFGGFFVAHHYRKSRAILLSIPLIVAGLFFKQQYVAVPAAILLYLVMEKRRRDAAWFAGITILSGVAILAYLQFAVYPGQSLLRHLVDYNVIAFSWNRFGWGTVLFAVVLGVPTLLGIEYLLRHSDRLWGVYLGFAVLFALMGMAKEGSGTMYLVEVLLINSVLVTARVVQAARESAQRAEVLVLLAVTMLLGFRLNFRLDPRDFALDRQVMDYLQSNFPKGVPVAGLGISNGALARAGFDQPIPDFYQYTWLVCRGAIPSSYLLGNFQRQRYKLVATRLDLYDERSAHRPNSICMSEDLHRTILDNYVLKDSLDLPSFERLEFPARLYLWVPKDRPAAEAAADHSAGPAEKSPER